MTEKYDELCFDCGEELYPDAKDMGAITVSYGKCPRCKKKTVVVPIRDFQTGNKGVGWD